MIPSLITPFDLTADRPWQWRATVAGVPRVWTSSLEEALAGLNTGRAPVPYWPTRWRAFFIPGSDRPVLRARAPATTLTQHSPDDLAVVPSAWTMHGRTCSACEVEARPDGLVDLAAVLGPACDGREAVLFAECAVDHSGPVQVYCGADYWMQWWIDGVPGFDTIRTGNRHAALERAHAFSIQLSRGRHVLAVRVLSGSGGWAFASEAARPTEGPTPSFELEVRRCFDVPAPTAFDGLTLRNSEGEQYRLNGVEIPVPLAGMRYEDIPGIPPSMLRPGANMLTRAWPAADCAAALPALRLRAFRGVGEARRPTARAGLLGIAPSAVAIQTGPLLAQSGPNSATVTCRTTAPVGVSLSVAGQVRVSEPGLFHRFDVAGLAADTRTEAVLTVGVRSAAAADVKLPDGARSRGQASLVPPSPGQTRRFSIRTLPVRPPFRFVVLGDVYPFDDTWSRIAGAALADDPACVVFTGDMVIKGRDDASWDPGFFAPAADLLSRTPFYWVAGNHDARSPLLERLLPSPGAWEWVQRIGKVTLVGIDGAGDWSEGSSRHAWLDKVLADPGAEYLFLFNHYPPWSSGPHTTTGDDGRPREAEVRTSRETIMSLAAHHRVTAVFSGHDHFYERSEIPGGPTLVVTGGAGSRLYDANGGCDPNPYSACLRSEHHHCLMAVHEAHCRMTVRALDGRCLDTREWTSRRPCDSRFGQPPGTRDKPTAGACPGSSPSAAAHEDVYPPHA